MTWLLSQGMHYFRLDDSCVTLLFTHASVGETRALQLKQKPKYKRRQDNRKPSPKSGDFQFIP